MVAMELNRMGSVFRRPSIAVIAAGALAAPFAGCSPTTPAETPTETVTSGQTPTSSAAPVSEEPTATAEPTTATPSEPPATTGEPSPEPSGPASPEPTSDGGTGRPSGPVEETVTPGATAHTRYFDVTVFGREFTDTATGIEVEVCYAAEHPEANDDGTTRVSTDPWRFGVYDGETGVPEDTQYYGVSEFEPTTAFTPAYEEKMLSVGECNRGWIGVEHGNPDLAWVSARYQPADFGDVITWDLSNA